MQEVEVPLIYLHADKFRRRQSRVTFRRVFTSLPSFLPEGAAARIDVLQTIESEDQAFQDLRCVHKPPQWRLSCPSSGSR